ncbi:MAG: HDIG domain-containing protein [Bacteroidetes bacterium]|nr:HDIG domain-containing protein [Bacteroidota bacterium]
MKYVISLRMVKKLRNRLTDSFYRIHYPVVMLVSFILAALLVVLVMPRTARFGFEYQRGRVWQHSHLYAPFDFTIYKTESQLASERKKLSRQVYPYFVFDEIETARSRERLEQAAMEQFRGPSREVRICIRSLLALFDQVHQVGIVQHHSILDREDFPGRINIVRNRTVAVKSIDDVYSLTHAFDRFRKATDTMRYCDRQTALTLLTKSLTQNLIYDETMSRQELEQAWQRISPTFGLIQKGELIISEGEMVDEEKETILNSLRLEYDRRAGDQWSRTSQRAGETILIVIIFVILFFYIRQFRADLFDQLRKVNMLLLLMLSTVVSALLLLDKAPGYFYLFPFGILPIILITFFDSRTTIVVQLLATILIAIAVPNAFQFVFLQFVVGYVVVFGLERHSRRLFFFRTSLLIFLAYLAVYAGFSLMQLPGLTHFDLTMVARFAASSALTLFSLPLIYLLERIFRVISDLSLLELSNTNNPLLRELALRAPGTFQHSIQVANLAEEALAAIGGHVLLARTGALYHDIGKMENPYYFIENQAGGYNPHDDITPAESAEIIIGHVLKGIEMARKAGLPEQIIDFIRTHHGTSRVDYFYIMAQRQQAGVQLDERGFRYHGPIPFSRETAVVMMADAVEASSRSLRQPTEQKINDLIEYIIGKQLADQQFVNADITLRDINLVKKIFKRKLLNIYHVRIAYPE